MSGKDSLQRDGLRHRLAVRAAEEGDRLFLFRLYCSIREHDFIFLRDEERAAILKMQFAAQNRHYEMEMPEVQSLIIILDGQPAGRLCIEQRPCELHLAEISLLPEHRNQGIGSILMEDLCAAGAGLNLPVRLYVGKHSLAVGFYLKRGFLPIDDDAVHLLMERMPG